MLLIDKFYLYRLRETMLLAVRGSPFHGALFPMYVRVMFGEPRHRQKAHIHVVPTTGYIKYLKLNVAHVFPHVYFQGRSVVCATSNVFTICGFHQKLLSLFFQGDLVGVNKMLRQSRSGCSTI